MFCFSPTLDGAIMFCCGLCACPASARCELMDVAERKKEKETSLKMAEGATSLKGLRAQMGRNSSIT